MCDQVVWFVWEGNQTCKGNKRAAITEGYLRTLEEVKKQYQHAEVSELYTLLAWQEIVDSESGFVKHCSTIPFQSQGQVQTSLNPYINGPTANLPKRCSGVPESQEDS